MSAMTTTVQRPVALVVEDDDDVRSAVCLLLGEAGYEVIGVSALAFAQTALDRGGVAVIVLDLKLQSESGRTLLERLAAADTAPPVVLLSGLAEAPRIAREYGLACVTKPFDIDKLIAALAIALELQLRPRRCFSS